MRPVPLTPAPGEDKALLKWCKDKIAEICRASQVDTPVATGKSNAGTYLAKSANLSDVASAATAFGAIKQPATEAATGVVELATATETVTGTDDTRAAHPKGVKAAIDAAVTALRDGVDAAYDTLKKLAAGKVDKAGDTMTGTLTVPTLSATSVSGTTIAGTTVTKSGGNVALAAQTFSLSGLIESPEDKDYPIRIDVPFAGTITAVTTKCASGTATLTTKINGAALGGTANSVSTSEDVQAHASDNAFAAGDDISLTVSDTASCEMLSVTIRYTRVLA